MVPSTWLMISGLAAGLPYLKQKQVRAIGVTSPKRLPQVPEVPAVAETVPGYEAVQWSAVMAPGGTPPAIIRRLHEEITNVLQVPEVRSRLTSDSAEIVGSTPEELAKFLRTEMRKWAEVAKAAGIEPQ